MKNLSILLTIAASTAAVIAAAPVQEPEFVGCRTEGDGFVTAYGGCYDATTGLVWSADTFRGAFGMSATYATYDWWESQVANSTYAGYGDWRLPTKDELLALAQRDSPDETNLMTHVSAVATQPEWSSTPPQKRKGTHRYSVILGTGQVLEDRKANARGGIAVRYVGPVAP